MDKVIDGLINDIKMIMIVVAIIVIINISTVSVCPSFGCNEVSSMNRLQGDFLCNVCVNISHTIQKYQTQLYFSFGVIVSHLSRY
jgi:hypothetical protein